MTSQNNEMSTEDFLLQRAIMYSNNNKKKLLEKRALRRVRRLPAVDVDQQAQSSGKPTSAKLSDAGPSGLISCESPVRMEEPDVIEVLSSNSEGQEEDEQAPTTANKTSDTASIPTWTFSPISLPTSPAAPENTSLTSYLIGKIPLLSILSLTETPRQESNNPPVPKKGMAAQETDTVPKRSMLDIPATPRPLDLTCPSTVDQEESSSTVTENTEHSSPLQSAESNQQSSTSTQCNCKKAISQNTSESSTNEEFRVRTDSLNKELPPWKRYSRGLTNQTRATQTNLPTPSSVCQDASARKNLATASQMSESDSQTSNTERMMPVIQKPRLVLSGRAHEIKITPEDSNKNIEQSTSTSFTPAQRSQTVFKQPIQRTNPPTLYESGEKELRPPPQRTSLEHSTSSGTVNFNPLNTSRLSCPAQNTRSNTERSASMIFTPGQVNQPEYYNVQAQAMNEEPETGEISESDSQTSNTELNIEQSNSMSFTPAQRTQPVFKQPIQRTNQPTLYESGQSSFPQCDPEQTIPAFNTDPLNIFRVPYAAQHTRSNNARSASMIFTPGQVSQPEYPNVQAQAMNEEPETGQTSESDSQTSNTELNIEQSNSMSFTPAQRSQPVFKQPIQRTNQPTLYESNEGEFRPPLQRASLEHSTSSGTSNFNPLNTFRLPYAAQHTRSNNERSASMIFTPGQVSQPEYPNVQAQAMNKEPETDPLNIFRLPYAAQHTRSNNVRSASMIFTPGQVSQPEYPNVQAQAINEEPEIAQRSQPVFKQPIQRTNQPTLYQPDPVNTLRFPYPAQPTRSNTERSASMIFTPGQVSQTEYSDVQEPMDEEPETDPMNQIRFTLPANTEAVQHRNMERSASMVYTPGQFEDQIPDQRNVGQSRPTFYDRGSTNQYGSDHLNRNIERSASMMFTPGQFSQPSFTPAVTQPMPNRAEQSYPNPNIHLNTATAYDGGQQSQSNFVHFIRQRINPSGQMGQHNFQQSNIQQAGPVVYNQGQIGQQNYPLPNPAQSSNIGFMPNCFTGQVRTTQSSARPVDKYSDLMSAPIPRYPPPTQQSAFSGAGAGYPTHSYNDIPYPQSAMGRAHQAPPLHVCKHCSKMYKTNTGLKNHMRRICERNTYDRYDRYSIR